MVIRSSKSKNDIQDNCQKKKKTLICKVLLWKLKIKDQVKRTPTNIRGWTHGCSGRVSSSFCTSCIHRSHPSEGTDFTVAFEVGLCCSICSVLWTIVLLFDHCIVCPLHYGFWSLWLFSCEAWSLLSRCKA